MNYIMKSGILYAQETIIARIKSPFHGPEKHIMSADGKLLLKTDCRTLSTVANKSGNVCFRQYFLVDTAGKQIAVAKPGYANNDNPDIVGWPVCRMPRVDHSHVIMDGLDYCLVMQNSRNYSLQSKLEKSVVRIFHRGLTGGWDIEASNRLTPEIVCGIFVFCRYIEQENEFFIC